MQSNVYPIEQPHHCSTCVYRRESRSAHSHVVGHYCDAPATKHQIAPTPTTELITGIADEGSMQQEFRGLFEHRSAGWWRARFANLCGREGRWWKRDPKTLRPPNAGSGAQRA